MATDASPYAVGAVLSHTYPDGTERPIQFASQTLTQVQQKYAQIDKEAYGIIFGIKKFYYYLYGRPFTLYVDHKPLVQILSPSKSLSTLTTTRMQHYALFLQAFSYKIKYKNTKLHSNADAMSRLPVPTESDFSFDTMDQFEIHQIENLPITMKELECETARDKSFQKLLQALKSGRTIKAEDRFNVPQIEFSLQNNCIFRLHTAVIPKSLRYKILHELHTSHFGVWKMKQLARSYCWWPNISHDIETTCKECVNCNKIRNNPPKVFTHPWETPNQPMDRVHIDFAGPFMISYFFILVDAYTRWPEIHTVKNMTAANTIPLLRKIFSVFGLPRVLVSDNAQTFVCYEFRKFLKDNGIVHKLSAPYHPATNGLAERYVQTFKQSLRALKGNESDRDKQLSNFLLNYRRTPHSVTGLSPSFLMFNREIRTRLDLLKPFINQNNSYENTEIQVRNLEIGERVQCRDYIHSDKWVFGRVHKRLGKLHYLVRCDNSQIWKRHIDQIVSIGENTPADCMIDLTQKPSAESVVTLQSNTHSDTTIITPNADTTESSEITNEQNYSTVETSCNPEPGGPVLRRSQRTRKQVDRLDL